MWKKIKFFLFDIKPENIIIDSGLNIKIIDFSVSFDYNKINSDKIKLNCSGSSFYMTPEVINIEVIELENIHKIDIHSLGVLLYRFNLGCYPHSLNHEVLENPKYDNIMNNNLKK